MRALRAVCRLSLNVGFVVAFAACLEAPPPPAVDGRLIFPGRDIERIEFVRIDEQPWVLVEKSVAPGAPPRGAVTEEWVVSWKTGEKRRLVENKAAEFGAQGDAFGYRYVMTDESVAPGTSSLKVGTLTIVNLKGEVKERIPGVSGYSVRADRFFYRKPVMGNSLQEVHLRAGDLPDRVIGRASGSVQFSDAGNLYAVLGDDRTLHAVAPIDQPPRPVRAGVSRFLLRGDEAYAILSVSEQGKTQTVLRDLRTGDERAVPGEAICCWMFFDGDTFVFGESATATTPARLHLWDFKRNVDRIVTAPEGFADVSSFMGRPGAAGERLIFDSQGRIARWRRGEDTTAQVMADRRPIALNYSSDGSQLYYMELTSRDPPEGPIYVQDAEFTSPPQLVTPVDLVAPPGGYFFVPDGNEQVLVFWAHYGRNASDLYFKKPGAEPRIVASGISEVTVTAHRLIGIIGLSQPDVVGDLVQKDVPSGEQHVFSKSVVDFTVFGPHMAFIVKPRGASTNDGVWVSCLKNSLGQPAGAAPSKSPCDEAQ